MNSDELRALLARVEAATGPLDPETACRLHALGQTTRGFVRYLGRSTGDGGGDEHAYEVDDAWCTHRVDARDMPDRSLDAVYALMCRTIPGRKFRVDWDCTDPVDALARGFCAALLRALLAHADSPNP